MVEYQGEPREIAPVQFGDERDLYGGIADFRPIPEEVKKVIDSENPETHEEEVEEEQADPKVSSAQEPVGSSGLILGLEDLTSQEMPALLESQTEPDAVKDSMPRKELRAG